MSNFIKNNSNILLAAVLIIISIFIGNEIRWFTAYNTDSFGFYLIFIPIIIFLYGIGYISLSPLLSSRDAITAAGRVDVLMGLAIVVSMLWTTNFNELVTLLS